MFKYFKVFVFFFLPLIPPEMLLNNNDALTLLKTDKMTIISYCVPLATKMIAKEQIINVWFGFFV